MQRLLHYIIIFLVTTVTTFAAFTVSFYAFNSTIDYSVVLGTTIWAAPILTVYFIVCDIFFGKSPKPHFVPILLGWLGVVLAAIGSYILYPEQRDILVGAVLFYGLPIAILVTILTPLFQHFSKKRPTTVL